VYLHIYKNDFSLAVVEYVDMYSNLFDWKFDLEELLNDSIKLLGPVVIRSPEVNYKQPITSGPLTSRREVGPMNFFTGLALMGYYIHDVDDLDVVCDPRLNKYYTWSGDGLCQWDDIGESMTTVTIKDSQRLPLPPRVQIFMSNLSKFRKQLETEILTEETL